MAALAESHPLTPGGRVPKLNDAGIGASDAALAAIVSVEEVLDAAIPPLIEAFTLAAFAVSVIGGSTITELCTVEPAKLADTVTVSG